VIRFAVFAVGVQPDHRRRARNRQQRHGDHPANALLIGQDRLRELEPTSSTTTVAPDATAARKCPEEHKYAPLCSNALKQTANQHFRSGPVLYVETGPTVMRKVLRNCRNDALLQRLKRWREGGWRTELPKLAVCTTAHQKAPENQIQSGLRWFRVCGRPLGSYLVG
jgi:hypothetical protein